MNQNWFRNLVAEKDNNFFEKLLLGVLRFVSVFYLLAVKIRNRFFDWGLKKSFKVSVPVVSIGNITTGGTGKTPLVMWLCNYLESINVKSSILTRGYKTKKGKLSDEPAILAKGCGETKVVVNPNRVEGARKAIGEYGAECLVMDDGFQHRRLRRDVDIVAMDATCPFGYGRLLPGGLLREPVSSLKRADAVVITRFDQADPENVKIVAEKIKNIKPDIEIAKAVHRPVGAVLMKNQKISLEELKKKKIFAFCGIGNPEAFLKMLNQLGMDVVGSKIFNDHHEFTDEDTRDIFSQAELVGADIIISTQKDWVKTALLTMEDERIDFAYLAIQLQFVEGEDRMVAMIKDRINIE